MRSASRLKHGVAGIAQLIAAAALIHPAGWIGAGAAFARTTADRQDAAELQSMTVPLVWRGRVLNDVFIRANVDGVFEIDSKSLESELRPLLNEAGNQRLTQILTGKVFVTPIELETAGFSLSFDLDRLEVVIDGIDGNLIPVQSLEGAVNQPERLPPTIAPAGFSAYLNANVGLIYREDRGITSPEIFLAGAARYGDVVVEAEGGLSENIDDSYRFYRQGVRAIYDEPGSYRRWSAGDLRLAGTPLLPTPLIAGVAVQKSRRIFDPFYPTGALGGRQIAITSPSTVDILVNGAPYRSIELQPGRYDLSELPVEFGANNIQLVVRDAAGRREVTDLDLFFDPLDVIAGEDEYSAAVGFISNELSFQPSYSNDPVGIFQYRRALSDMLLLGGGVQLSEEVQLVSFETQFVPQVIPGSFQLAGAVSTGNANGVAFSGGYRWYGGANSARKVVSVNVDYQSGGFRSLADFDLAGLERVTATASYSQTFSQRTYGTAGASYSRIDGQRDQSTFFADVTHRLTPALNLTVGAEYGSGSVFGRSFGVRLGLTMALGGQHRVDATYQSRRDYARATYSKATESHVGAYGYSIGVQNSLGNTGIDGAFDYIGNRFDARLSVASEGNGFGNITDRQVGRLQLGTSIAFADGAFGIGRPIQDSFALVEPHSTVESDVIVGRSLSGAEYEASSGTFGAAVLNRLSSYNPQEIQYDLKRGATGYDIGTGIERVAPPYRSGYRVTVGNDRFVSAVGFLEIDGAPASLVSGRISAIDDEGFQPLPFFTNSNGRFGVMGLAPGKRYTVTLNRGGSFEIVVPEDNRGLLRLDRVSLSNQQ